MPVKDLGLHIEREQIDEQCRERVADLVMLLKLEIDVSDDRVGRGLPVGLPDLAVHSATSSPQVSGAIAFSQCLKGSRAASWILEPACADLSKFASTSIREQIGRLATATVLRSAIRGLRRQAALLMS